MRFIKNQRVRVFLLFCFVVVPYLCIFLTTSKSNLFMMIGGLVGFITSLHVIYDVALHSKESVMKILLWKSVADLGIAVRFLLNPLFDKYVCGSYQCTLLNDDPYKYEDRCGLPSAFHVFFQTASELWFLCIAIDLGKTLQNPFSSTKDGLKQYHLLVWSLSLFLALFAGLLPKAHGYYDGAEHVDGNNDAICWVTDTYSNIYPICIYYVPLGLIYTWSIGTMIIAYHRLSVGISQTLAHRIKALVVNSINMFVNLAYWLFVAILYFLAKVPRNDGLREFGFQTLLYFGAAKGLTSIWAWILTIDIRYGKEDVRDDEGIDLNGALRHEVLYYATKGIQNSCENFNASMSSRDGFSHDVRKKVIRLEQQNNHVSTGFAMSFGFLIRLMMGSEEETQLIADIVQSKVPVQDQQFANESSAFSAEATILRTNLDVQSLLMNQYLKDPLSSSEPAPDNNLRRSRLLDQSESAPHTDVEPNRPEARRVVLSGPRSIRFLNMSALKNTVGGGLFSSRGGDGNRPSVSAVEVDNEEEVDVIENTTGGICSSIFRYCRGLLDVSPDVYFVYYEPIHFQRIRKTANISDDKYIDYFKTTVKERVSQGGASGAFFFFSKDEMFIAKSCTKNEFATVVSHASQFADYYNSPKGRFTYISKIYGAYKLQIYSADIYFFVMANLFYVPNKTLIIHEKYDIKGSTVNRTSEPPSEGQSCTCRHCGQKFLYHKSSPISRFPVMSPVHTKDPACSGKSSIFHRRTSMRYQRDKCTSRFTVSGEHEPNIVLKDNDLKYKLRLPQVVAKETMLQICSDAKFLKEQVKVMDYSLLVGVHNTEFDLKELRRNTSTVTSQDSPAVHHDPASSDFLRDRTLKVGRVVAADEYMIGIIDYQQKWDRIKTAERFIKTVIYGKDPDGLSAMPVGPYHDRFINHVREILDVDESEIWSQLDAVNDYCEDNSPVV